MGRNPTNRGRVGIQPVPIDDLKLQGYIPKTLYVPDDIPVNLSMGVGQYEQEARTLKTDNNGDLYVANFPGSGHYRYKIVLDDFNLDQLDDTTFEYRLHSYNLFTLGFIGGISSISDNTASVTIEFTSELPSGATFNLGNVSAFSVLPDTYKITIDFIYYYVISDDVVLTFVSDKVLTHLRIGAVFGIES